MRSIINKKNWRPILTVVTLIALLIFIFTSGGHIIDTFKKLKEVDLWVLWLMIPLELLNYYAQTLLYQDALRTLGYEISNKFLYRFSLELNFIATLLPSAGLSAVSYTNLRLKSKSVSGANATLLHLIKTISVFLSFLVLLVIGLLLLAISGKASPIIILFATVVVTILVILTGGAFFIVGSEKRIDGFFTWVTIFLNKIVKVFRPKIQEAINIKRARRVFSDLHHGYMLFRNDPNQFKGPFLWGLLANFTEVAVLYVVYIAFGHWVNPGGIILAYAVANIGGFLSVLPGGVGVYESLMTIVLVAAGVPASLSLPITVTYRILNTVIQIAPGYVFYQRALIPKENN
ncbi:MAG TPA: YbhN family protein [Candidatus Saccharimonadales bacterium]